MLQGHCDAAALQFRYTVVTPHCNATKKGLAPNWRNQITFESLEKQREFDPISLIHLIAPTPLLIIAAEYDNINPVDALVSAYKRALEPKSIKILPCSHFDIYNEPWVVEATRAAIDWFKAHL